MKTDIRLVNKDDFDFPLPVGACLTGRQVSLKTFRRAKIWNIPLAESANTATTKDNVKEMITIGLKTIKTGRLLLRQIVAADIGNIFRGLSHPDVIKYYGVSFQTLEATKEQMTFYADLEKDETGIWFAVCSLDNKIFYGAGGLNSINKEHKKAEIGFWLLTEFWGQGIMTEAMPLIYHYGFDKLGLHRIEGFVEADNVNCKRAMAKLAFRHEGTMQDCEIKNGKFISLDIYAKINTERQQNI